MGGIEPPLPRPRRGVMPFHYILKRREGLGTLKSRRRVPFYSNLRDTSPAGATLDQPRDCDSRTSGGCPLVRASLGTG